MRFLHSKTIEKGLCVWLCGCVARVYAYVHVYVRTCILISTYFEYVYAILAFADYWEGAVCLVVWLRCTGVCMCTRMYTDEYMYHVHVCTQS